MRRATHDEYVGDNTPPGKTLPQSSEGPLKFRRPKGHRPPRSRSLQIPCGEIDPMLAEGSRRPDQRVGPLNLQLRREPWPPQHTSLRPLWRGKIMPCGQMLSQCRQRPLDPQARLGV
jgi:hypothetical protein